VFFVPFTSSSSSFPYQHLLACEIGFSHFFFMTPHPICSLFAGVLHAHTIHSMVLITLIKEEKYQ